MFECEMAERHDIARSTVSSANEPRHTVTRAVRTTYSFALLTHEFWTARCALCAVRYMALHEHATSALTAYTHDDRACVCVCGTVVCCSCTVVFAAHTIHTYTIA